VRIAAAASTVTTTRSATVTIGGKTVTITQQAPVPPGAPGNLRIVRQ
jgi:hypothetical protein